MKLSGFFSRFIGSVSKNDYFVDRCSINYPPLLNGRIRGPAHYSNDSLARSRFYPMSFFSRTKLTSVVLLTHPEFVYLHSENSAASRKMCVIHKLKLIDLMRLLN